MEPVLLGLLLMTAFFIIPVLTVRIVPPGKVLIIERFARYSRTLETGIHYFIPIVDKVFANIDLREQAVSFPLQPVITRDNIAVTVDMVTYYSVIDAKSAVYEIPNFISSIEKPIEQPTVTALRNVIGSLDLDQTLTSRDRLNSQIRGVVNEATEKWGIRVNRVEVKSVDRWTADRRRVDRSARPAEHR